jgi:uncharacterized protein YndB with AHSA1/START domain
MEKIDRIEREIVVSAPQERVWAALTDPEELARWFGDSAEVDLRPGGAARFGWEGYGDSFHAVVETVDPPNRFAYRWAVESDTPLEEAPSTLVEFTLEPGGNGTIVRLVESGFAALPDDQYEETIGGNKKGWTSELGDLVDYVSVREGV